MTIAPMLTGYGLTETSGNGALGCPLQYTPTATAATIGPVTAAVELKLVSIPDLNYHASASPPQGEILLRGRPVLSAYFDNPDETAKAVTADGWFRTGDIGQFEPDGHVSVIDRVKNLVKLQGGEYIALEKLEAVYRGVGFVANIMVHGDAACARPVAVVVPNEKVLAGKAREMGVAEGAMYGDARVRGVVLKALREVARKEGLSGMETVGGVVLVEGEWTPANVSSFLFFFFWFLFWSTTGRLYLGGGNANTVVWW
jgi:long-chain acyl-CoA synthetase